jgi:hypothetical protein
LCYILSPQPVRTLGIMSVQPLLKGLLLGSSLLVVLVGFMGASKFSTFDSAGWIPHTRSVHMFGVENWHVGESRECSGMQMPGNNGLAEINSLFCDPSSNGVLPHASIRFWGMVSRPESTPFQEESGQKFEWHCKKSEHTFTCYALN